MAEEDRLEESSTPSSPKGRFFGRCCNAIAAAGLLLIVIFLLLPMFQASPAAARRMQCCNNLRNIAAAMNSYSAKYGCYPPAYTVDKQGRRMHSWRTLLLEFLNHDLYTKYDFTRPWDGPGNVAVTAKSKGDFRCSADCSEQLLDTSYVMLVGPQAFSDGPNGRRPADVSDGAANTIAVVEMCSSGIPWTAPRDLNVSEMSFKINDPDSAGIRSSHAGGAFVLFADGSVQYLTVHSEVEKFLKELSTIDGKEDISKIPRD